MLLLEPLTGSFVADDTLGRGVQKPFTAGLAYLLLGAAIAGLFARPLRWPHVLGLVIVPTLFVGGLALGAGLAITYGIDPSMSGRYGLSAAPLLALVLAASLRGAWVIGAVGAFAAASFATTLLVLAV